MMEDVQVVVEGAPVMERPEGAIAPWWHTAAVVVVLVMWAALSHGRSPEMRSGHHVGMYASTVMMEWMLLGAVVAGVYSRRQFFFDALSRGPRPLMVDVGLGVAIYAGVFVLFALVVGMMVLLGHRHGFDQTAVKALAPQSGGEMLLWVGLSASAGICEELVFRGYLLQQTIAWMRSAGLSTMPARVLAVLATAILFGSLHLYEGNGGASLIVLLGAVYAVAALLLGNLRAVMVAHTLQDLLAGLAMFALLHVKR